MASLNSNKNGNPQGNEQTGKRVKEQTGKQANTQAGKNADKPADMQGNMPAGRQGNKLTGRQANKQTGTQADKQGSKNADKQGGRNADKQGSKNADKQGGRNANKQGGKNGNMSTLGGFAGMVTGQMRELGRVRIAETYETAVRSFMRFLQDAGKAQGKSATQGKSAAQGNGTSTSKAQGKSATQVKSATQSNGAAQGKSATQGNGASEGDIALRDICGDTMKEYEHWLREECGVCRNTVSFYMRNLRAVYNRAVEMGLTCDLSPFRHVYTGIDKTGKRAVSPETIRAISVLELDGKPELQRARDYFLLIFQLRGISFVDLARLETGWIQGGYLRYRRQKTGQALEIRWEESMQEIVERYHAEGSRFLLPILSGDETVNSPTGRRQYQSALRHTNACLNKIGTHIGCAIPLTTYTARHAWASAAHNMHVPIAVISQALGHDSEKTTRIYLNALDSKQVDDVNSMLINIVTGRG